MFNIIKSEMMKQKGTLNKKLVVILPIVTIGVAYLLMGMTAPTTVQMYAFNIWYVLFLPFLVTWVSSSMICSEKKYNYHGLFSIVEDKSKIWYGKIVTALILVLGTSVVFGVLAIICGNVLGVYISLKRCLIGSIVLVLTVAWQIPFSMYIASKTNLFTAIMINMLGGTVIGTVVATKSMWWIPYAIPGRVMCPMVKILPNALPLDSTSPLNDSSVIMVGIVISIIVFAVTSIITAQGFKKQEV